MPADDIPSSPPLPPTSFALTPRHARKRQLSDYEDSLSSDPIFSEDASGEDEQTGYRRKRHYRGPWWAHGDRAAQLRRENSKGKGGRKADSGVWMGSDSTDERVRSDDSVMEQSGRHMRNLSFREPSLPERVDEDDEMKEGSASLTPSMPAEDLAARIVMDCVESGNESIDLSDMCLRTLPKDVIRPLHQLIRVPPENSDCSIEFMPFTPELKVFLYKNDLASLPEELWKLENITCLSLRNNILTELPPSVGKLRKLQELNVAGNQIQWLPWDLLDLISRYCVVRLTTSPNPLWSWCSETSTPRKPSSVQKLMKDRVLACRQRQVPDSDGSGDEQIPRIIPIYGASSAIRYFDSDGVPARSLRSYNRQGPSQFEPNFEPILPAPASPPQPTSAAPSLFELSLRMCRRSPYITQLPQLLPDDAPPPVVATLQDVLKSKEEDREMPRCTVCGTEYVIRRAEWMEYWHCGDSAGNMSFLPFLRHACSWRCAETVAEQRCNTGYELDGMRTRVDGE